MAIEFDAMTLAELIGLQSEVVAAMNRRFQKNLALVFSDVVESTAYFARFGDVSGRALQQRHLDLVKVAVIGGRGRIVDTAGDGAFAAFPSVDLAVDALVGLGNATLREGRNFPPEHKLRTRVGLHFGPVLTDGVVVSGDAVNLAARVASSAQPGEIRLTKDAYRELSPWHRVRCRSGPSAELKGYAQPVPLLVLEWRDRTTLPTYLTVKETGERIDLGEAESISFGRLDERQPDGTPANDVVLRHPDAAFTETISRWHFELRRHDEGLFCRSVSDGLTVVDGVKVARGSEAPVVAGSVIEVAGSLTLVCGGESSDPNRLERMKATVAR